MYFKKDGTQFNSQQAIRNAMPNTSLPMFLTKELLNSLGIYEEVRNPPAASATQKVVEGEMVWIGDEPTIQYALVNKTVEELAAEAKALVPQVVTMRQARLALLEAGLLVVVETAVANGTDEAMKIEWEYATEVRRDWASLITLTTAMSMTEAQLDALFVSASNK